MNILINIVINWIFIVLCTTVLNLYYKNSGAECTIFGKDIKPNFYITGDKHRNFKKVIKFCKRYKTRKCDVLIILGDSGFNYFGDYRDDRLKAKISKLNITLFCLHGNKENRPENVGSYGVCNFYGAKAFYEPNYPNILFAIDGEIYNFEGREYITVGGAHSVDKIRCIEKKRPFWNDEMPNSEIKSLVESRLSERGNRIYGVLTHTCPKKYLPTEVFVSTKRAKKNKSFIKRIFNSKKQYELDIDRSTEEWLDRINTNVEYSEWFCGHYHVDKEIDKIVMMYSKIRPLQLSAESEKNDDI